MQDIPYPPPFWSAPRSSAVPPTVRQDTRRISFAVEAFEQSCGSDRGAAHLAAPTDSKAAFAAIVTFAQQSASGIAADVQTTRTVASALNPIAARGRLGDVPWSGVGPQSRQVKVHMLSAALPTAESTQYP